MKQWLVKAKHIVQVWQKIYSLCVRILLQHNLFYRIGLWAVKFPRKLTFQRSIQRKKNGQEVNFSVKSTSPWSQHPCEVNFSGKSTISQSQLSREVNFSRKSTFPEVNFSGKGLCQTVLCQGDIVEGNYKTPQEAGRVVNCTQLQPIFNT